MEYIKMEEKLKELVGSELFEVWKELTNLIESKYTLEKIWADGGKKWNYSCRYKKGSKTFFGLYAKENCIGFMLIFGKKEREKFESEIDNYSEEIKNIYYDTETYHDGKWLMFMPTNNFHFKDFEKLMLIKRKPDKKDML
ncbi:DUF3788 domain-containing protein [Miniphocaeibacter massiliensis]|uniref:DUF3788 domain-containing protein n=1 Tax=Miniphocaeibacter massiliensis TaxID=2041841 RepID=UPI000C06A40E|nr:DUF3788 domain-containing protein [Miniphocaeibacter massiliensis]